MKKLLLFLILFISLYETTYSQDFFPLNIGNKFVYQYHWSHHSPGGSSSGTVYQVMNITDTLTINSKKYFYCSGIPVIATGWLRVDTITKSLYSYNLLNNCEYYYYENLVDSLSINYTGLENSCNNSVCYGVSPDSLFGVYCYRLDFSRLEFKDNILGIETHKVYNQRFGFEDYNSNYFFGSSNGLDEYSLKGCIIDGIKYGDTTGIYIGIVMVNELIPSSYSLSQNYPNPFNPMCNVQFSMSNAGNVKITVYNIQGREIQTLVNERLQVGTYEVKFDGSKLTSGVYFYRMVTSDFTETKRMLLIK